MQRRDLLVTMALGLAGSVILPLEADFRGTDLLSLVHSADLIVIARVDEMLKDDGVTVARAIPIRGLKGSASKQFFFVAEPTWTCDISRAELGETVLLMLEKAKSQEIGFALDERPAGKLKSRPLYRIGYSGRGRMVIETVRGQVCATVSTDGLQLPATLPRVVRTSRDADSTLRSLKLAALEKWILREVKSQARSARK